MEVGAISKKIVKRTSIQRDRDVTSMYLEVVRGFAL